MKTAAADTPNTVNAAEADARRYVRDLRRFYRLLFVGGFVVALTFAINFFTAPGHWWFLWVALGVGIAATANGLRLALRGRFFGRDWEDRKVQEVLARDAR